MRVIIEKVSEKLWGEPYLARSVETKDKKEYSRLLSNPTGYERFLILDVEYYHKEKCTEVVFHDGSWTKTREEIMK
jgi:hypothetical protein